MFACAYEAIDVYNYSMFFIVGITSAYMVKHSCVIFNILRLYSTIALGGGVLTLIAVAIRMRVIIIILIRIFMLIMIRR